MPHKPTATSSMSRIYSAYPKFPRGRSAAGCYDSHGGQVSSDFTVSYNKILVRATNWLGDAVMSLPALRALRQRFPGAEISILAKPWVADLYHREAFCDRLIPYVPKTLGEKWAAGRALARDNFDCAILLQNAFEAAAVAYLAGIPERIGYARDGRRLLLTRAIAVPRKGEIPRHERFYYLELLHRAGILDTLPENDRIRLDGAPQACAAGLARFDQLGMGETVVGMSPGAAYGSAKRWLPERFAEAAGKVAGAMGPSVTIFGSKEEREFCETNCAPDYGPSHKL